jgi:hypothetical protein
MKAILATATSIMLNVTSIVSFDCLVRVHNITLSPVYANAFVSMMVLPVCVGVCALVFGSWYAYKTRTKRGSGAIALKKVPMLADADDDTAFGGDGGVSERGTRARTAVSHAGLPRLADGSHSRAEARSRAFAFAEAVCLSTAFLAHSDIAVKTMQLVACSTIDIRGR